MQALEKLTLAYLALQERADKLQSVINATQYDLAELQAKYKATKEQKAFLQTERNKWYDAYNLLDKSNDAQTVEQADEIRNLKQCIEELESQLVALTPKERRLDEPTDGYEAEKRVCRADFKASETTENQVLIIKLGAGNDLQYIVDRQYRKSGDSTFGTNSDPARAQRFLTYSDVVLFLGATFPMDLVEVFSFDIDTLELEPAARVTSRQVRNLRRQIGVDTENKPMSEGKANGTIQPVILLANQYGDWVHGKTLNSKEQTELLFTTNKELADQFANLDEVEDFLDDCTLENITISYHHPQTLELLPNPKAAAPF